ncbi:MAG: hypothetical protein KDD40_07175 [Bdellovibrionales bacterium]|nr:hypothetical protein [Bdellovibrionales bacterium]
MFAVIRYLLKQDFKNNYFSKWYIFSEVLSIGIGLSIYWFTSKALSPHFSQNLEWYQLNYFSYVVLGEAFLMLPLQAFNSGGRIVKGMIVDGIIDGFICIPGAIPRLINSSIFSVLVRDLIYMMLMLVSAKLFLGLNNSWASLAVAMTLMFIFMPGFLGLGQMVAGIVIYLGRGQGLLAQAIGLISVLSGVYFPLSIFKEFKFNGLINLHPYSFYLSGVREYLAFTKIDLSFFIYACLFALISLLFGHLAIKKALILLRKKGLHLFAYY